MTTAILSFATPGSIGLRCPELGLDERRALDGGLPFAAWIGLYGEHHRHADVMLALGVGIGQWLDGDERWLERLVAGAVAPLIVEIEVRARLDAVGVLALDVPWELIGRLDPAGQASASAKWRIGASVAAGAMRDVVPPPVRVTSPLGPALAAIDLDAAYHLALDPGLRLGAVRRLGTGAGARPPSPYRLSVVFMAAQPDGVAGLDVDGEEAALRAATGGIGMDLTVDESGTLAGLGETMARVEACDVAHVSCHGVAAPRPVLLLEDDDGARVDVTADELASGLTGQTPALTFLSACSTAAASLAGRSLASELCRRGWPAVLGWAAPVADRVAIGLAAQLYRHLSRRQRLVDVMAQLRRDVAATDDPVERAGWHLARLYLGPGGGDKIVDGTRPRVIRGGDDLRGLLGLSGDGEVPALAGRRRVLQRVQAGLRRHDHAALICGGSAGERAGLAERVARRQPELRPVVVTRYFDAPAVLNEICTQTIDAGVQVIAARHRAALVREPGRLGVALREILQGPCQRAGSGAILLVVHALERVLVAPLEPGALARPDADHLTVVVQILQAFRGAATESRLLVTSARGFAASDTDGDDLMASLVCASLDG